MGGRAAARRRRDGAPRAGGRRGHRLRLHRSARGTADGARGTRHGGPRSAGGGPRMQQPQWRPGLDRLPAHPRGAPAGLRPGARGPRPPGELRRLRLSRRLHRARGDRLCLAAGGALPRRAPAEQLRGARPGDRERAQRAPHRSLHGAAGRAAQRDRQRHLPRRGGLSAARFAAPRALPPRSPRQSRSHGRTGGDAVPGRGGREGRRRVPAPYRPRAASRARGRGGNQRLHRSPEPLAPTARDPPSAAT